MKLTFQKDDLLNGINIVLKAVPSKTTMPILECILIDASDNQIKLTANDMELGIETKVEGSILSRGKIALDAKLLSEIIRKLSGGERRRLYLLKLLMSAPNVLILDEPTNDLDIETLEVLEDYLDGFAGIIITVSHDRYFLDRTVDRIFAFEAGGHLTQYEGGYSDYKEKCVSSIYNVPGNGISKGTALSGNGLVSGSGVAAGSNGDKSADGTQKVTAGNKTLTSKEYNKSRSERLKFTYKEQKEYESIDDDIAALESDIERIDSEMAKCATDYGKLNDLSKEKAEKEKQLEEKMDRWVYLNDLAERIANQ